MPPRRPLARSRAVLDAGPRREALGQRRWFGPARARPAGVATINQRSTGEALDALPTTELMRQVLGETKELVRIETRLAREELAADLGQLKKAAVLGGVAVVLALLSLATLVTALVLALGGALVALIVAVVMLLGASVAAGVAYGQVPKPPLARTRARLESDVKQLERHIQ
jgi:uncharacterized membrane protein YqjE